MTSRGYSRTFRRHFISPCIIVFSVLSLKPPIASPLFLLPFLFPTHISLCAPRSSAFSPSFSLGKFCMVLETRLDSCIGGNLKRLREVPHVLLYNSLHTISSFPSPFTLSHPPPSKAKTGLEMTLSCSPAF